MPDDTIELKFGRGDDARPPSAGDSCATSARVESVSEFTRRVKALLEGAPNGVTLRLSTELLWLLRDLK